MGSAAPAGGSASNCICTDGSMIDGPTKVISRVGFGVVAYDENGEVTVKAYGASPSWIDSVPGAETRAFAEALMHSVAGVAMYSDCLSVVKRFKACKTVATFSAVELARLWKQIFELCDSFDCLERQVKLE